MGQWSTRLAHQCRFRYGSPLEFLLDLLDDWEDFIASILLWSLAPFDLRKFCLNRRTLELKANWS